MHPCQGSQREGCYATARARPCGEAWDLTRSAASREIIVETSPLASAVRNLSIAALKLLM